MDTNVNKEQVLPMLRGAEVCRLGEKWTCTIQCDGGTRYPVERIFNAPGAEVCLVQSCTCQPVAPTPPWAINTPQEVIDATIPLAIVIFAAKQLLAR